MSKDNGGPAFSVTFDSRTGRQADGLSVRDYFAAKAMQGLCADPEMQGTHVSDVSRQSYEIADAMLAERAK